MHHFAVLRDGAVIGSTSYLNVVPEHRRLEIGNTWNDPSAWGTGANTEAKYLLLGYAFEKLGMYRVEFKTDAKNERARAALAAIPSEFEGIHRKHMVVRGGERRDSAWYAVIDDDWPQVKARSSGGSQLADRIRFCPVPPVGLEQGEMNSVNVIGRGRVGSAVAARLEERGVELRDDGAELVLLCVPDRAIAEVAGSIDAGARGSHTCQRRHPAGGARPARAALLRSPAADVHARARARAARRRLGGRHCGKRRGARDRL